MKKFWVILMCLASISQIGFGQEMIKESRKIESFNSVSVSSGIDLYIRQSNFEKMAIEAPANKIDKLVTVVKNGNLEIYYQSQGGWNWGWNNGANTKIYLTIKDIKALSASGGSDVFTENRILADKLNINVSGGSDIDMELNAEKLNCSVSGGSDVKLIGMALISNISVSGGADFDGKKLKTQTSNVSCSGGADASVWAVENLKASASGGADIYYYGNPPKISKSSSGGGDIYRK